MAAYQLSHLTHQRPVGQPPVRVSGEPGRPREAARESCLQWPCTLLAAKSEVYGNVRLEAVAGSPAATDHTLPACSVRTSSMSPRQWSSSLPAAQLPSISFKVTSPAHSACRQSAAVPKGSPLHTAPLRNLRTWTFNKTYPTFHLICTTVSISQPIVGSQSPANGNRTITCSHDHP